jgi:hypothetical protein
VLPHSGRLAFILAVIEAVHDWLHGSSAEQWPVVLVIIVAPLLLVCSLFKLAYLFGIRDFDFAAYWRESDAYWRAGDAKLHAG